MKKKPKSTNGRKPLIKKSKDKTKSQKKRIKIQKEAPKWFKDSIERFDWE